MRIPRRRGPVRRPRPARRRSLALELLVLQALLLGLVVVLGFGALYAETRTDTIDRARQRVLDLSQALAAEPLVVQGLRSADPTASLQPFAEQVRRRTGVLFVVIMSPQGIRYTHPERARIGGRFTGTIAPAQQGRALTETFRGTLGPSVRSVVPIEDGGRVVGLLSIGISTGDIGRALARQLPGLALFGAGVLAVALAGAGLVSRRLRRLTHGMGAQEISRLYEYYDAVLRSVREGLVLVDTQRRVLLVNDEGHRLLGLPADVVGTSVDDLTGPPSLVELIRSGRPASDELHLTGSRVLLVNQAIAVRPQGRGRGTVLTVRDRTDLQDLTGELDSVRSLSESLRSQAHESANRMHTVVSLLELGRAQEAVRFATAELDCAQRLTDVVVSAVEEPVLAAMLLGKTAQAAERGVELALTEDTAVPADLGLSPRDLVTIVGNLVDNAIDAAADGAQPARVSVTLVEESGNLVVQVADTGPGLDPEHVEDAFRRGWSTKPAEATHGRGLGLALVGQVVHRLGGTVDVEQRVGAVFTVMLPLRRSTPAGTTVS